MSQSLAEKFAAVKAPPRCPVAKLIESLPEKDADALKDAALDLTLGINTIVDIVREDGHSISHVSLKRHREHKCGCET